jgi:DNA-binding response OmpR family regulator
METPTRQMLVVEDDDATARFLADNFHADGFAVWHASEPGEALRALELRQPDVLLLDLGLSGAADGFAVLDRVRSADAASSRVDPDLPVIVVSGRVGEVDRVRGFARGADDYLCKPFSYPELLGRVEAVLRRSAGRMQRGVIRVGELTVDPAARAVRLGGKPVTLAAKEFALLHALASAPERVWTKPELLRDVWGYAAIGATRTIDAHASRLRKKLSGGSRRYVQNVRGIGYRLTEPG